MSPILILLSLASVSLAQEQFFAKYGFTKAMVDCLGEEVYYGYLTLNEIARKECQNEPVSILPVTREERPPTTYPQFGYPVTIGGETYYVPVHAHHPYPIPHTHPELLHRKGREATPAKLEAEAEPDAEGEVREGEAKLQEQLDLPQPFFDRQYLEDSVSKIMSALSNYTCILKRTNVIDEYLNLKIDDAISQYFKLPIDEDLRQDLIDGLYYCRDSVNCLPLERLNSPLPVNLQRLFLSMKCEKKWRTKACFKHDLRKNKNLFDFSIFVESEPEDVKLNKLATILIGGDSIEDELELV